MRIAIDTLGCKVNRYDSVVLEEELIRDRHEVVSSDECADVYVVNSCTVTSGADSDTRQLIRRFQKKNSDAIIFVTGCSAQTQPEVYASMPGVHFVIGSDLKSEIPRLIREIASVPSAPRNDELRHPEPKAKDPSERLLRSARNDETARNDGGIPAFAGMTSNDVPYVDVSRRSGSGFSRIPIKKYADWSRAFIKVQDGCDNFCTFCIIPYSRGRGRSQKISDVINQINVLVDEGYKEVVITGVDLMTYGKGLDGDVNIVTLIEGVLDKTGIERLRISSIEPGEFTDSLISLASVEPRLCPHFHLSVQSCCDEVLRRMRRRYGVFEIKRTFETIAGRLGDAFIGIDMIAGFSGERDIDHRESVAILSDSPWSELHVFPYSEREGTAGVYLKDMVCVEERNRRARELRALSEGRYGSFLSRWGGRRVKVLPEKYRASDGDFHRTISREYLTVLVPKGSIERGREYEIGVIEKNGKELMGKPC